MAEPQATTSVQQAQQALELVLLYYKVLEARNKTSGQVQRELEDWAKTLRGILDSMRQYDATMAQILKNEAQIQAEAQRMLKNVAQLQLQSAQSTLGQVKNYAQAQQYQTWVKVLEPYLHALSEAMEKGDVRGLESSLMRFRIFLDRQQAAIKRGDPMASVASLAASTAVSWRSAFATGRMEEAERFKTTFQELSKSILQPTDENLGRTSQAYQRLSETADVYVPQILSSASAVIQTLPQFSDLRKSLEERRDRLASLLELEPPSPTGPAVPSLGGQLTQSIPSVSTTSAPSTRPSGVMTVSQPSVSYASSRPPWLDAIVQTAGGPRPLKDVAGVFSSRYPGEPPGKVVTVPRAPEAATSGATPGSIVPTPQTQTRYQDPEWVRQIIRAQPGVKSRIIAAPLQAVRREGMDPSEAGTWYQVLVETYPEFREDLRALRRNLVGYVRSRGTPEQQARALQDVESILPADMF